MRVGFVIIARMKSTRLPKKTTLKINGKEIISLMIERLKLSPLLDEIIVATSTNPDDGVLCELAEKNRVKCFKGSEDDVLERMYLAAKEFDLDYVVHVTGDCPLVSFDFIGKVIEEYKKTCADLITTFDLPHGFFLYGLKPEALKKVLEMKSQKDTEVWMRYFSDTRVFKIINLKTPEELKKPNFRLTLDYPEDFEFFKALFKGLGKNAHKKTTNEIITFLDKHPKIVEINEHCEAMYKKRWDAQNKAIKLK
ncbi:MAG: hypothetical protein ISS25_02535 [Nanoarchaeota archaeon]|nr:hypothetical protein [DPANN group archaeon]MBL7116682.1 hypothetical protein [Nanoarchaeota archaeon]